MRPFAVVIFCSLFFFHGSSIFAADAAVEAQEGNVEHWIEYYKKERAHHDERVKSRETAPAHTERGEPPSESAPEPAPQIPAGHE